MKTCSSYQIVSRLRLNGIPISNTDCIIHLFKDYYNETVHIVSRDHTLAEHISARLDSSSTTHHRSATCDAAEPIPLFIGLGIE